ncbi:glycosyltransferase family 39 protein [Arthrobacter bambusae]|uniref:glycosyltransferase family 39 protein n=1 Tax=Arthrobacter bambusae TaxID=1338426 RepID=UPI002785DB9E|nr:glycosyltransferase family 39 protein [Arthrobacter bambusae]MDQ0029518.1 4-amino-4-deoxy-L-arabinose transferase-like glycosyltransferase [Arthrobacter bambusae]MDQ0097178.1 4-amino-4-deoxy-L-arabinose transferase-like glycosyltransferase [Arthrobacter bambusae]
MSSESITVSHPARDQNAAAPAAPGEAALAKRWERLAYGENQPRWVRPSAAALLLVAALVYLWNLTNSGYANSFYAAAIQSGTKDWTALLFASLDPSNAITVDKPPAAFWIPALLGRVFGFSSFTMLLPQAVMGIASVGLLYLAVKRAAGPAAGLVAGAALAATPVAALMFRFNNPDAMMVFCLMVAAWLTVAATQKASPALLFWAGTFAGMAFLSKMLEGLMTVPALGLAYLLAAPVPLKKRLLHLLGAAGGITLVSGAYALVFQLTPVSARPYMAGSQGNSLWELVFGYNGLSRILGRGSEFPGGGAAPDFARYPSGAGAAPGGGGAGFSFGGPPGVLRLFGGEFSAEVAWLLPTAFLLLAAGLWFTRRAARTDAIRASLVLWGTWLVITAAVFSFMSGTIHAYYTVELAPAVAALTGIVGVQLWRHRSQAASRAVLVSAVLLTSVWSFALLSSDTAWLPWLRWTVLVTGVVGAALIAAGPIRLGRAGAAAAILALLSAGLGTGAWTVATAATGHTGGSPAAGPDSGRNNQSMGLAAITSPASTGSRNGASGRFRDSGPGTAQAMAGGFTEPLGNAAMDKLLQGSTTKWSAATVGANSAAALELGSNTSVMAIGGFSGSDPFPTLDQFKQMVASGQISYFVPGSPFGGPGGQGPQGRAGAPESENPGQGPAARGGNGDDSRGLGRAGGNGTSSAITQWVEATFPATTVGGSTVYKLHQ